MRVAIPTYRIYSEPQGGSLTVSLDHSFKLATISTDSHFSLCLDRGSAIALMACLHEFLEQGEEG